MPEPVSFFSKLLLFGEYTLISGSKALACPLYNYSGRLIRQPISSRKNRDLIDFIEYLINSEVSAVFHLKKLKMAKDEGLAFVSDIPVGYGVGSSGALCAAFYNEFAVNPEIFNINIPESLIQLKRIFTVMESYFHGRSSGIDPLVSFAGKPLLLNSASEIQAVNNKVLKLPFGLYMYDSGIAARTSGLVNGYIERMANHGYKSAITNKYIPLVDSIIHSVASGQDMQDELMTLSQYQLDYFINMIPDSILPLWKEGLRSGNYCMKLCGSGGGGYFLVFAFDKKLPPKLMSGMIQAKLNS